MTVYLKLMGPNSRGLSPKGCFTPGWQDPGYKGIDPLGIDWVGMRLDDLVVIDCDDLLAVQGWIAHTGQNAGHTWTRETPHGWHLIYAVPEGWNITTRHFPTISEKMELKHGCGHQIVFDAPGYKTVVDGPAMVFDPAWLPEVEHRSQGIEEWSEMPDGIGDTAMMSFAGKFRDWGMDEATILECLAYINIVTMVREPMPDRTLVRLARQAAKYETGEHEPVDMECPGCGEKWEVR